MVWVLTAIILIMIIFFTVFKVKLVLICVYNSKERYAYMSTILFGVHIFEREISLEKNETEKEEESMLGHGKKMLKELKERKKHARKIHITHFSWETNFGTGDAVMTGMSAGGLWGMKGYVLSQLGHICTIKTKPEFTIKPDFQDTVFDSRLRCIGAMTVGQAIRAYIQTPSKGKK